MNPTKAPVAICPPPHNSVIAYVDGMNLYYGAVKQRPEYKWLDIQSMLEGLFPNLSIDSDQVLHCQNRSRISV